MNNKTILIPDEISALLRELVSELQETVGHDLDKVILYGSYSRGDYSEDSDIDIMVLTSDSDRKKYNDLAAELSLTYLMKYGTLVSLAFNNRDYYDQWKESMDLFQFVEKEGILLL